MATALPGSRTRRCKRNQPPTSRYYSKKLCTYYVYLHNNCICIYMQHTCVSTYIHICTYEYDACLHIHRQASKPNAQIRPDVVLVPKPYSPQSWDSQHGVPEVVEEVETKASAAQNSPSGPFRQPPGRGRGTLVTTCTTQIIWLFQGLIIRGWLRGPVKGPSGQVGLLLPSWLYYHGWLERDSPDPWADPESRSTLGFYNPHHRIIKAQSRGIYFLDCAGGLGYKIQNCFLDTLKRLAGWRETKRVQKAQNSKAPCRVLW